MISIIHFMESEHQKLTGRGGAGRGQGRKALTRGTGDISKKTITVDQETSTVLTAYGDGNFSEGVRRAAKLIKEQNK